MLSLWPGLSFLFLFTWSIYTSFRIWIKCSISSGFQGKLTTVSRIRFSHISCDVYTSRSVYIIWGQGHYHPIIDTLRNVYYNVDVRSSWYLLPLLLFFFFFFLILWCTQKAYYPNVNSIAFVAFFQTGWGNKAWIRNFMRDSLPPNHWIGYRFCIMVLTSLNHSVTGK